MRILIHSRRIVPRSFLLSGILALQNDDVEVELMQNYDERLTLLEADRFIIGETVYRRTLEGDEAVEITDGWLRLYGVWQLWLLVGSYKSAHGRDARALQRLANVVYREPDSVLLGTSLAMEFIEAFLKNGDLSMAKMKLTELEWCEKLDPHLRELIAVFNMEDRDRV